MMTKYKKVYIKQNTTQQETSRYGNTAICT